MNKLAVFLPGLFLLPGCASHNPPCEEILEVQRQERMCADLKKQMNNKSHPQIALTARERYQQACVELRYYRDDYDTICKGDEKPIGKR